ncbi:MAG TPA: erythromycin esterase family protein, partial [Myxococcaceae bacterium]|nr:erythromycin esterase family protein [Myxococcaceae bacterium]
TVPKGKYNVTLEAANVIADMKTLEGSGDVSVQFDVRRTSPADQRPPQEVIEWLRVNAISLATPEAGHGFNDLQQLKQVVGNARVVALGEATHGTREFFQLKHRMFEFLATEMGFTVFAIEASYPEALMVNDYVLNGKGDPTDALAAMRFWTWNTEEVLELIQWMRRYNEDSRHKAKLEFYGFDMQSPSGAIQQAVEYLQRVDPTFARDVATIVAPLDNDFDAQNYAQLPAARAAMVAEGVARILKRLDDNKDRYLRSSSAREWVEARMNAKVAIQGAELARRKDYAFRDRSMAENIKAVLDQQAPGTRLVVWAHNAHVSKGQSAVGDSMGRHLANMFGTDLVVFGFAFNQGSFQAIQMPFGKGGLTTFTVPPAAPGSLDASLATAGKLFAIDLRGAPPDSIVAEWLASPLQHREIGAGFSYESAEAFLTYTVPRHQFDALLFVDNTSSARPNGSGRRSTSPAGGVQQKMQSPMNLDFEDSDIDGKPTGWIATTGTGRGAYGVVTVESQPFHGKRCVSMIRTRAPWRWGYDALFQNLDAAAYRGRRIRFRAAARGEISGMGNKSELFVKVLAANAQSPTNALSVASTMDHPVRSTDWQLYDVETSVPPEADSVTFGFVLTGNGRVWFDDASLEIIDDPRPVHP